MARRPFALLPLLVLVVLCTSCKLGKRKNADDGGAPLGSAAAELTPVPVGPIVSGVATPASAAMPAAAPTAPPVATTVEPPPDPAFEKAKSQLAEVQALLKGAGKDGSKPAESDLKSRCEEIEAARAKVESRTDPDVRTFVEAAKQTCGFDVPVFSANAELDQMRFSASQASKLLVCKTSERDIAKARSMKPNHWKVRQLETRQKSICHN